MARSASGRGASTSSSEGCAKHDFGGIFILKKNRYPTRMICSLNYIGYVDFWVLLIESIQKLGALESIPTEMKARAGRAASKF